MSQTNTTLSVRTEKELKDEVGKILDKLGLNHSTAINMYYHQIVANQGIPFSVKLPNQITLRAIDDSRKKRNSNKFEKVEDLFDDLGI